MIPWIIMPFAKISRERDMKNYARPDWVAASRSVVYIRNEKSYSLRMNREGGGDWWSDSPKSPRTHTHQLSTFSGFLGSSLGLFSRALFSWIQSRHLFFPFFSFHAEKKTDLQLHSTVWVWLWLHETSEEEGEKKELADCIESGWMKEKKETQFWME